MMEMSLCKKNILCVDCKDEKCLGAGEIISDCPKYHCDREKGHIEDCETCEFIKQFQKDMRKEYNKMYLWQIIGRENSEFEGIIFGFFTSKSLAEIGFKKMPYELKDEVEVSKINLPVNCIIIDGKEIAITEEVN